MMKIDSKLKINYVVSAIMVISFILLELVSIIALQDNDDTKLLLRVIARGIFGLLMFYNSLHLLFTNAGSILGKNLTLKQRRLSGILIGIVGLIMIVTAFLGYGTNGDPRYYWWK